MKEPLLRLGRPKPPTALETLLLAAARASGEVSPYSLRQQLDLSLGTTVPALRRLSKEGLVERVAKAQSRAQKYSLTPRGTKVLERWAERAFPDVLPADTEAVLRIVGLVCVIGGDADRKRIPPFLKEAARLKERSAEEHELKAKQHFEIREREWNEYLWMSNLVNAQRLRGEAAALTEISESFGDGVPRTCRTYSAGSKEEPSVGTGDDSVKKENQPM